MSTPRGNFPNAGHFYSNVFKPIKIDLNFVVDSTNANGLGVRAIKSNGYVHNVFMQSSNALPPGGPILGTARAYAVLGASTVTNTGASVFAGNVGLYPGTSITGITSGMYSGYSENIANGAASQAQADALALYSSLTVHAGYSNIASALDGQTLSAGYYDFASGAATLATSAPGTLTLNGSASDIFVIKTASTLTMGAGGAATVALTGGAKASNVYWLVGSSATIDSGTAGTFQGNLIAYSSITSSVAGGTVNGSLIALNGAVTFGGAVTVNAQAANALSANPSPAPGVIVIQLKNNFNSYLGGFSGAVSPVASSTKIDNSALTIGQPYVITVVGDSTLAQWQSAGLPAGVTPAVGVSFIATAVGSTGEANTSTSRVMVPGVSGITCFEVIGNTKLSANSSAAVNGGMYLIIQCLGATAAGNTALIPKAPANESVIGMSMFFDGSSVNIDGL